MKVCQASGQEQSMKMTCQSLKMHSKHKIPMQTRDHIAQKKWQVWGLMQIITAPYLLLGMQPHSKEQHYQHLHLNQW